MSETELREVVQAYAEARAKRDDAIRRAAETMSLRQIAAVVGLSHTRIAQILSEQH